MVDSNPNRNWYPPFAHGNGTYGMPGPEHGGHRKHYRGQWEMGIQAQMREFFVGAAEMSVHFGRGCKDIVIQTLGREDSFLVRNFGRKSYVGHKVSSICDGICTRLKVFDEFLPEDKDPASVWTVISLVFVLALAVILFGCQTSSNAPLAKKVSTHPPSATRLVLPDGRHIAYKDQGVTEEKARCTIIAPHSFLSSRLCGIPGLRTSLLEEFGVRLITYDLPGFGESDPHPNRNLESSAYDLLHLSTSLGIKKFWVLGYSSGSLHAWAALRYIPDQISGAAMFAPMVNPYDALMTREERRLCWEKWTPKRKFLLFLARRFPTFLSYFYHRTFLSGRHGRIDKWLSLSLGTRDKALVEDPMHETFWQRDVEEAIRQGVAKPFIEEAAMQVSNWGFSLADIKFQRKKIKNGFLNWVIHLLTGSKEEFTGFIGPIHVWQGMDDLVVPPSMTDFVHRILPGAALHKLPYEGHFTYFYFCEECHRQIFTTLFGIPQGPLETAYVTEETQQEDNVEDDQTRDATE